MGSPTGTQAIDRAARLLTLVVQSDGPRSFTSLADELDLAKSTTSRLLQALERHHLVRRDGDGAFRAGPLFTDYAARHDPVDDLVQLAEPRLQRLGDAFGETVNLSVPRGDTVVQVAQVDSTYLLSAINWIGVDTPPHCTAIGKVFYAYGTLPLPGGRLERRTSRTLTSRDALERSLDEVRRRGYAVAAPVRALDGSVVAAIAVSGPTSRIEERIDQIARLVVAECRSLSTLLGHDPGDVRKEGVA